MSYSNKKRKKYQPVREKKFPLGVLLPVIAFLSVIPLITFMKNYNTNLGQFEWYTSYTDAVDFFLYYKMVWIIGVCVYMILCTTYLIFAEEKKPFWSVKLIPMIVYCAMSALSAIASKYSYFSIHGIYEQFEPVWVLLGYGIIIYYTYYVMGEEGAVRRTMNWFVAGICVMIVLGLTQTFKHDFFRTDLGQKLMTPSTYTGGPLVFNFEIGRPYLTLYNPNYVGFYAALTIPILVALFFTVKKIWVKLGYAVLIAGDFLILFASQSRAGIVALFVSAIIMYFCMRKFFFKNWKVGAAATVGVVLVVIIAFFVVNKMNDNVLITRMQGMFSSEAEYHPLKEIQTNDDNITIVYQSQARNQEVGKLTKDDELVITSHLKKDGNDEFELKDGNGKKIDFQLTEDSIHYQITDPRFPFLICSVRSDSFSGFEVTVDGYEWYFSNLMKEGDSTYYCQGGGGALMKLYKMDEKDTIPYLENHYMLANKRGYIWARTIPLLKKYFFLGSGPDTFIIAYPNNDLVGMYNSQHINEIITKPHCMYLQTGVQTGVISLIALLVFFGWYLIDSLLIYWKNSYTEYMAFVGVGIFAAVIGYLILSLTNDSCTAIAPIFYTLLGIGGAINYKLRKAMPKKKQNTKEKN